MKHLRALLILPIIFILSVQTVLGAGQELVKNTIMADGHPMALWEKTVENPKGYILLHHGRTWSSLPDFDLQVEGEELSLMDGFNEKGYSVWALDARGYGETPRDDTGWNTPQRAAKDLSIVLEWLENKNGEKIHLWGWSMGSMIGQLTAQIYPENIESLTLFGYPLVLDFIYPEDIQFGAPPRATNTAEAAASDFLVPGSISQNAIDEYVRHSLAADPVRADWNYQHQYNELDATKVSMPVLLLQGEFDPLAHTDFHADAFSKFPNADKQWVVLKGGDHAALLETPRAKLIDSSIGFIEWLKK
ncbi:MAG: alpha/beta fold hydrolase [Kordiimonadaceae bacterium]|jgi:pimeloyl-ACP methyl ester carboxylesterase|nr:alpha/beta fold hydrolase [Kordiimonadaceae bacterium]MBT6032314.1 alpha/beta fold hydrolase [Kordiimonadaceae bacterium]